MFLNYKDFIKNFLKDYFYLLICLSIVFLFYSISLTRPWLPSDESLFYNELLFPIPMTLDEMPEIIKYFGVNYHTESSNTFFSNILNVRSNPLDVINIVALYLFKKNAFPYHLLHLLFHLINTGLAWLILKKTADFLFIKPLTNLHCLSKETFGSPPKSLYIY